MQNNLLNSFWNVKTTQKKAFAILIDPDGLTEERLSSLLTLCKGNKIDYFFVGGSLITNDVMDQTIRMIKNETTVPVILFPGNSLHISSLADGILFLSLISGRNAEFLIGQQVVAAPVLKASGLEIMPTGYMLIDGGRPTTVSYMSNTNPIPHNKPAIAACTAMAGEMLGLKVMYLDAGSGAENSVSPAMVSAVRQAVDTPIIVGGGIDSSEKVKELLEAGADIVVVGNGIEKDMSLIKEIAQVVESFSNN
ncbi:MAG: geranylgeranylglyceryl/heptaprenylglyceryl phosphate synthase [Spirosomataceae bacterium]